MTKIRFEEPRIASPKEMEQYEKMTAAKWDMGQASGDVAIAVDARFDVDRDSKNEFFSCVGSQPFRHDRRERTHRGFFVCSVCREGAIEVGREEWKSEAYRFNERTIRDLRYGDIDQDGDIDVAFKMSDGAIYVYHNITPSRIAPK